MKVADNIKSFFVDMGKDFDSLTSKENLSGEDKGRIITSLALKAIGLLVLTFAAVTLVSGLCFAATLSSAVCAVAIATLLGTVAHDVITIGANLSLHAKQNQHAFGFAHEVRNSAEGLRAELKGFIKDEKPIFIPPEIKGTVLVEPVFNKLARLFQ